MKNRLELLHKINHNTLTYNDLLRSFNIIALNSDEAFIIKEIWKENVDEYGEIKYILRLPLERIAENKYTIICLKPENGQKDKMFQYYSYWSIQIPY